MRDEYAPGHDPQKPIKVSVQHHQWSLPDAHGPALAHLTGEDGKHYNFSFTPQQVWFIIRRLVEIKSRMSDTKRDA